MRELGDLQPFLLYAWPRTIARVARPLEALTPLVSYCARVRGTNVSAVRL